MKLRALRFLRFLARAQVTPWPLVKTDRRTGRKVVIWWSDVPRLEDVAEVLACGLAREPVTLDNGKRMAILMHGEWL